MVFWASHRVMGVPGVRHERLNKHVWDSNVTDWGLLGWDPSCGKCVQVRLFMSMCGRALGPTWLVPQACLLRQIAVYIHSFKKNGVILSYLQLYLYFIHWMLLHYLAVCRYGDIRLLPFLVDNVSFSRYLTCVIWGSYNCAGHSDPHYFS